MNPPRPSVFCFISDLSTIINHAKVRFLGCVSRYDSLAGDLYLEHNYPQGPAPFPSIRVHIAPIIEDVDPELLEVGTWVNVVGYVRNQDEFISYIVDLAARGEALDDDRWLQYDNHGFWDDVNPWTDSVDGRPVFVDAMLVWSAGAVNLGEYERIQRNLHDLHRRLYGEDVSP
ncbi:hypothetical protein N7532_010158 [Penicillium argentinense]|uniref:Uncharacterized protein n=1 Tax=Penicillium argentinense TaxID=1131581 RepID=A0A9W9EP51_9EURO|nr:uncharacterized protein N7532_010158 [Penicillium argentinense]KAJ5085387.1 hypothetical protein N7532_010158 [Penicillium argentinense]